MNSVSKLMQHKTAMTAAFLMEGLREVKYTELLDPLDMGCYELVLELVSYSQYVVDLKDQAYQVSGGFHGVYEYEVTSEFGSWFAAHIQKTKAIPEHSACCIWLIEETIKFLIPSDADLGQAADMKSKLLPALKFVRFRTLEA
jgi:hypothetical protein